MEYDDYYIDISINKEETLTKLIASKRYNNYYRIWDFHNGNLLDRININNSNILSNCLWNNEKLFAGSADKFIYLINLKIKKD